MTNDDALSRPQRSREAFYGRHKGKALSPFQASLLGGPLDRLRVDLDAPAPADPRDLFTGRPERLRLEIGFGGGEHLHHETARFPQDGFIGVEPFVNGMAKMLVRLESEPRGNLRLYDDDAVRLLDWLPPACLDGVDLFYPDPWPKMKHWKRRFVSARNLDRLARVLKPGAPFRFASDIENYVDWTLALCASHEAFGDPLGTPDGWTTPYEAWPGTRYEAKAHREGRHGRYLTFVRSL